MVCRNQNNRLIIFIYLLCFYYYLLYVGRIEFNEFAEIMADAYFKKFSRAEILEAFRRFDDNRDGYIEAHELKNVLDRLGRHFSNGEVRCFDIFLKTLM